jgi:Siderophore-interacting protein
MTNVAVVHAPSGLVRTSVVRRELVTPHMVRVTFGGGDLEKFEFQGFDQWFRLAVPTHETGDRFDNLPDRFGVLGYLKYLTTPAGTRPAIRNYTARAFRPESLELDVDFVVHGDEGVAAPWAATVEPGTPLAEVALIDQGRGWKPVPHDEVLLIGDETALPAIAGILRDLPRDARGHAVIEVFDVADKQPLEGPEGVEVHWVVRDPAIAPGAVALPALSVLDFPIHRTYAFAAGESSLATGARRYLVEQRGVPKQHVTFCGYWKLGKAGL